ncbi:MAG: RNA pseudouridine synthase [Treponema sp.]|nr:RNA pseudouridine synthase [Treponema sp.]
MNGTGPYVLDETGDFAVVYKPPRMHCAPLKKNPPRVTLLEWYARVFPPVRELGGRREGEGGLLHRLDFETRGLVLFAKTRRGLEHFLAEQEAGAFIKEYSALCRRSGGPVRPPDSGEARTAEPRAPDSGLSGFPPAEPLPDVLGDPGPPLVIESFFRPFGKGRKEVRPVIERGKGRRAAAADRGGFYRTEIIGGERAGDGLYRLTLRISRGFRHQIRCHLAWKGCPILNDPLYGPGPGGTGDFLALCARALFFTDPRGEPREYRISRPDSLA